KRPGLFDFRLSVGQWRRQGRAVERDCKDRDIQRREGVLLKITAICRILPSEGRCPMPRPSTENETARLEARIPVQVYDTMQRAARLRGMTLTGYLLAT